ncbi:hypothetical protein KAR91_62445 [Candidatus Pacearchaeota archaeon]|nr:hypothetical protein [Candidatus Pacearchaeota archaeon]
MDDLGLDTIYWQFSRAAKMYYGDDYEITQTKHCEWWLWSVSTQTTIGLHTTAYAACQAAESDKQKRAITS